MLNIWVYVPLLKKKKSGNSLWSSGWDSALPLPRPQLQSLIGELRYHKPSYMAKKPPKNQNSPCENTAFLWHILLIYLCPNSLTLRIVVYMDLLELGAFLYLSYNLFRHTCALKHWFFSSAFVVGFFKGVWEI